MMKVKFCPLASGSKGNCLYLATEETKILIDAGLSRKATLEKLAAIGVSIEDIDAILISHDHGDHIAGLKLLAYRHQIPILANAETAKGIIQQFGKEAKFKIFTTGEPFCFGDLEVTPFSVPHDTMDPVMFTIQTPEHKFGICSDLGFVTSLVKAHLQHCDYLYIEANHEPDWVMACSRPMAYKERVLSRTGHISNSECGQLLKEIASDTLKHIYLAHLSSECNAHPKALEVVGSFLEKAGIKIPISVAPQETLGHII
jgi:phosphoribosyl 1,2-cyclic phosphodiesterase